MNSVRFFSRHSQIIFSAMQTKPSTILLSGIGIVILLMILSTFVFHFAPSSFNPFSNQAASVFNISADVRQFIHDIAQWHNLAKENQDLKSQLMQNLANQDNQKSLEDENAALRAAVGLSVKVHKKVIPAGIFQVSITPTGYTALINKGTRDGVTQGNTVTSSEGNLIGTIQRVSAGTSTVTLISDPSFQVTARILSSTVTGIARGALGDGMRLDLIVQSDVIQEGDTLISTGDDTTPAGLVVGVVRLVQANEAQLFKTVLVTPSAQLSNGHVLIIQ